MHAEVPDGGNDAAGSARAGVREIVCPQCAGANPLATGEALLTCTFCGSTLYVDRSRVVGHFRLPRLLDRGRAEASLRRWMAGNDTVKDLDRKSRLDSLTAVSFPMWLFRTGPRGREVVHVEPAAPTPISALADLAVPAGELEPYAEAEEGAESVIPTVPLTTARGWLSQRGAGEVSESSLVEIPLWRARYSFAGRSFEALVEGSTGRVLASVYPEKAESPYVLVAVLGLLVFAVLGLAISNPAIKLLAFGCASVPLALAAWWVTRRV